MAPTIYRFATAADADAAIAKTCDWNAQVRTAVEQGLPRPEPDPMGVDVALGLKQGDVIVYLEKDAVGVLIDKGTDGEAFVVTDVAAKGAAKTELEAKAADELKFALEGPDVGEDARKITPEDWRVRVLSK